MFQNANTDTEGSNLDLNLQEHANGLHSQKRRSWALERNKSSTLALPDMNCVASGLLVHLSEPEMSHLYSEQGNRLRSAQKGPVQSPEDGNMLSQ